MKLYKILITLFALTLIVNESFAGGQNRAGTYGAPELRIPVGARYLGMAGAPVAVVSGLESIYWNPAGVDVTDYSANAMFSTRSYIADMSMNFAAVSGRFGEVGSFALSFRALNIGDIPVTTMDQPDGTGQIINPNYFILSLNYSKQLTDRVSVGAGINLINESIDRVSATGLSFDFGVQYRNLFEVPGLAIGVVVKNLGPEIKFDGNGLFVTANDPNASRGPTFLKVESQSSDLPSEMSIGVSYAYQLTSENSLQFSSTFQNNNYTYDNYSFGLEYSFKNMFYLRGGYLFSPQADDKTPNIFANYTLGAGVNLKQLSGLDVHVDYAFVPVKIFDESNHVFAISLGF